jgi:hypothetical protein
MQVYEMQAYEMQAYEMLHVFHIVRVRAWIFPLIPKACQYLLFQTSIIAAYRGLLLRSKFSMNGITIDPRPVLGEPIP